MIRFFVHCQNYFSNEIAWQTWSLAVEEHFYLALPLLLWLILPIRTVTMVMGFAGVAIACGWMRSWPGTSIPDGRTHLRIDSLFFGVLLAFVFHYHRERFDRLARHPIRLIGGGLVLVGLARFPSFVETESWACVLVPIGLYLGYGAILVGMMGIPDSYFKGTFVRMLTLIGFYSYTTYLWHLDGAYKIIYHFNDVVAIPGWLRWLVGMGLYTVVATGTGILMSRFIEVPALAVRDRLFPRLSEVVR